MYYARNTKNLKNCITLFEGMEHRTFIIFDTETTGLDPEKDYIVELAAMKYEIVNKFPVLTETLNLYIRPPFQMEKKVIEIHHITNEFLNSYPPEDEQFQNIQEFFGESPILLGYNVDFDISMLNAMYARQGAEIHPEVIIDVMEMGYDLFQDKTLPDHKLGTIVNDLGMDADLEFHNALDDTTATFRLLIYCYEQYKSNVRPLTGLTAIYVNYIYFWKGYRKEQSGVYVNTNLGKVYYSTYKKTWCSSTVNLIETDLDSMEKEVLRRTGLTLKELGKMTENKFRNLKASLRESGVYL